MVVTTEKAVHMEIVMKGPEGPVGASGEAGGSGSREYRKRENYGWTFALAERLKQSFDQVKGLMGQRRSRGSAVL